MKLGKPYVQYFYVPVLSFPKTFQTQNDNKNIRDTKIESMSSTKW
jgi:hypothetical protein